MADNLVWMRRDLRLYDHAALHAALQAAGTVQPVFVFDTDILKHFPNPKDRRLSFLAAALCDIDAQLQKRGGGVLVLHGPAGDVIPKAAAALSAKQLCAAEDYEPAARKRDAKVAAALSGSLKVQFVKDQVMFAPQEVLQGSGAVYKVFTPYANAWRSRLRPDPLAPYEHEDAGRYADVTSQRAGAKAAGLACPDLSRGPKALLAAIGYDYSEDALWRVDDARERLARFISQKSRTYGDTRDAMAAGGTSRLSPYLRFGLVSVRECVRMAVEAAADKWLAELIWREFYAMTLFHAPESERVEWNPKYRGRLAWSDNEGHFTAWAEGKTGYPVVDAAMRQLLAEGWMHNRARMVVASFLTKHLRISWKRGEEHFAQHLMDYDLASNVGGWQWAASTGTDAQPYFRVFNPVLQSERFDPEGDYIRRYVPELKDAPDSAIHAPWKHPLLVRYMPPVVDHARAREEALAMFKSLA
jgi:deoxyribodipyrimidine photo-lyase